MIVSTFTFAMHVLVSSFRVLGPVGQVLEYVLPQYRNMASAIKGKINFNTKHLKKGDPLPPYNGKLRVYNMRYCPYAQRTILALNAKKIDYEVININLVDKPEWLPQKSAFGKVPAIEIKENVSIYESLITVDYLEEVYPEKPLLPKDPVKRAFDKIIVESISPLQAVLFKLIKAPDTLSAELLASYEKALLFVENQLKSRETTFLDGSEPGYADYMIWPWFERILAVDDIDNRVKINKETFKLLSVYLENMSKDPVVSEYRIPKDVQLKFFDGYKPGQTVNYELLTEN